MESETFSDRKQNIGRALAWATIARDSESLWGNAAGFVQATNFLPSYRWGDYVIFFLITLQFLLMNATEQM